VSALQHNTSERIDSLDLLRGMAAFAVMVPHFFMYYLRDAATTAEIVSVTAVEVFFVLSGFVLGPQIVLCAERRDWLTVRTFLVRRWMRTIPSYLVALLAISVIFGELGSGDFFRYATYVQNLSSQYNVRDYFPVAWSLSVEEWYYVAFPPFLLLYVKLTKGTGEWFQYACATVLLITCISLLRFVYADTADWGAQVRRVVVFRIDSIAYGFLLYLVLQRVRFEWSLRLGSLAFLILAAATVVLIKVNQEMLTNDAVWLRHIHPFASAAFGVSTLVFFLSLNSLFQGPGRRAVCSYLGRISYPMYLFHLAVLYGLVRVSPARQCCLALPSLCGDGDAGQHGVLSRFRKTHSCHATSLPAPGSDRCRGDPRSRTGPRIAITGSAARDHCVFGNPRLLLSSPSRIRHLLSAKSPK
jgi:peptidoglycan/LPS O-acetylase OafA/YrhL